MNCGQAIKHGIARVVFALIVLLGAAVPALSQENPKPSPEKWRPKDGLYAKPGADFDSRCNEYGDIIIELAKKFIGGSEWGCKVTDLTDTTPDSFKLNMVCYDPNASEDNADIMSMTRINSKSVSVQTMERGNLTTWQADYCPDEMQRAYARAKARERAESERKGNRGRGH